MHLITVAPNVTSKLKIEAVSWPMFPHICTRKVKMDCTGVRVRDVDSPQKTRLRWCITREFTTTTITSRFPVTNVISWLHPVLDSFITNAVNMLWREILLNHKIIVALVRLQHYSLLFDDWTICLYSFWDSIICHPDTLLALMCSDIRNAYLN